MRSRWQSMVWMLAVLFSLHRLAMGEPPTDETLRVLPATLDGGDTADMMRRYLIRHAYAAWDRWKATFENTKTPEQIDERNGVLRQPFFDRLGAFPEKTPLNPRIAGTLEREGYRVEKTIFESQPGLYVSAAFFIPDSPQWTPPYPGVLEPDLFAAVRLVRTLVSWSNVVHTWPTDNQLINTVHGALQTYDLPDLAALLGDKLTIEQPVAAQGNPVSAGAER